VINQHQHFRQLANFFIWLLGLCLALLSYSSLAQTQAFLESPSANAFVRSGVGLIRGWACDATQIEISINDGPRLPAGYGTQRPDTASVCGDLNNGFGLTFNWNSIGDGVHHLQAFVDGVEFANVNFTVTTLGQDFITGLVKNYLLPNFPGAGQSTPVRWSEPHQNFVIAQATAVPPPANPPPPTPRTYLESPTQGSFESGVGLIRGWVCDATRVEISVDGQPRLPTAYGTQRPDTASVCGDLNNGFGLTFNWNSLDDGVHHVQAFADGVEFASVNSAVTTLGADFLTGLDQKVALDDFPSAGQNTTLRWSEPDQNFTLAQTTATPPKLAIVSVITDLRNAFTVAGAGTDSTDATGVRAAKNAQGQPIQLQGVAWTNTQTGQAADIQLTADGLPTVYTDSAGVEARFSAFTETTAAVSFHDSSGNVLAGPVTTPVDGNLILALQEMARRVFNRVQSAEAPVGERRQAGSDLVRPIAATAEQVFTLSQLLANVYWYGSQATGEMVCAVERAAATVGVSGLIASTACQSPLIAALRARFSTRQGQAVIPDSGVDPIVQQSLQFDDDVVEAPCNPATDGAACLIQPVTQLQERQQEIPPPIAPEPEAPTQIQVTTTAGPGGTITPTTQTVNAGATARFTVTPNSGYQIASITGCGGSLSGTTYTTGPITGNCAVSASFTTEQTYTVTATAGPGGTISPPSQIVDAGATVRFTVTPNSGYMVASVTGCGGSLSGATYTTGPITGNCAVSASFTTEQTYILTLNAAGTGTGTVGGAGNYAAGDTVTLTATPNSGSVFAGWSPAPCAASFTMPAQNLTCIATFRRNAYTVTATAGPGGTITPATQTVEAGATARFTVTPNSGYQIASITGCGGSLSGVTYTTGPITEACTISASFTLTEPPAPPTGVSASDGAYTDRVQVTWNTVTGATYYEAYTFNDGPAYLLGQSASASFNDTSATPGSPRAYLVKACNNAGCSAFSDSDSGYVRLSAPTGGNVACENFGFFPHCTYSWNAVSGAVYYYELYDSGGAQTTTETTSVTLPITAPPISRVRACGRQETICSDFLTF